MDNKILEENKKLIEEFPFLLLKNVFTGEVLDDPYESTWLDSMPEGWAKAFGMDLCNDLKAVLIKGNYLNDYQIVQIKEKFGALRWYSNGVPCEIYEEYIKIIDKYEALSEDICINCGKPAKYYTKGWVVPICEDCANNFDDNLLTEIK